MTSLLCTIAIPQKNTVIDRRNITNFVEKEHGIYFYWEGARQFINWKYIVQYALIED